MSPLLPWSFVTIRHKDYSCDLYFVSPFKIAVCFTWHAVHSTWNWTTIWPTKRIHTPFHFVKLPTLQKYDRRERFYMAATTCSWWAGVVTKPRGYGYMNDRSLLKNDTMTSSNGSNFRVTGPLCGEFSGPRWIPRTKASGAQLWCFLWSASE